MADQALNLIGDRLRAQRHKLHMSLDVLASRTNLSKSFLSQVERGIASPSIESLHQIAEAIGVPMFLFFVEEDGQKVVRPRWNAESWSSRILASNTSRSGSAQIARWRLFSGVSSRARRAAIVRAAT